MAYKFNPELWDIKLSGWFNNDTGEVIEGFKISAEDSVLDVGCGNGAFLAFCARQGAELLYVDIDPEKVKETTQRIQDIAKRNFMPLVSDSNPLPIADNSVSKVMCLEVIEHVDDPESFLQELVRVGEPGAQYLLAVPDPVAEHVQEKLAPSSYFEHPNHIRIIERDMFEKMVSDSGLIVEKRTSYGFYKSIWWLLFWACDQEYGDKNHPLLESWKHTWGLLLDTEEGPRIKQTLDEFMPKSQAIIARKK